jgi:hypothetical protein
MTEPTITIEPCTNYSHTRRHYSINLHPARNGKGREGTSLCRVGGSHTGVYDDDAINALMRRWKPDRALIVVADLPECKACLRVVAKLEASRG